MSCGLCFEDYEKGTWKLPCNGLFKINMTTFESIGHLPWLRKKGGIFLIEMAGIIHHTVNKFEEQIHGIVKTHSSEKAKWQEPIILPVSYRD